MLIDDRVSRYHSNDTRHDGVNEGTDTLSHIEMLQFSGGDTAAIRYASDQGTLIGSDGHDILVGSFAADTIEGGGDDDVLYGGEGNDRLVGGDGWDKAVYLGRFADYVVEFDQETDRIIVTEPSGAIDTLETIEELVFIDQSVETVELGFAGTSPPTSLPMVSAAQNMDAAIGKPDKPSEILYVDDGDTANADAAERLELGNSFDVGSAQSISVSVEATRQRLLQAMAAFVEPSSAMQTNGISTETGLTRQNQLMFSSSVGHSSARAWLI